MGLGKIVKKVGGALGIGGGGGGGEAAKPQIDPALFKPFEEQKAKAEAAASKFKADMPGLEEEQNRADRSLYRQNLTAKLGDVAKNSSSRGLLFSGLKQAGDAGAAQDFSSDVMQSALTNRSRLQAQGSQLDDQAIQSGLALQQAKAAAESGRFDQALNSYQQKQQNYQDLGGGLSQLYGSYLGGAFDKKVPEKSGIGTKSGVASRGAVQNKLSY